MPDQNRFAFGENWASFLSSLDRVAVDEARRSLQRLLQTDSLSGKCFLDVGSGSGLFSLAAVQMGARVTSIDLDPNSVRCTQDLRDRLGDFLASSDVDLSDDVSERWQVQSTSVLHQDAMRQLGTFDVVYSWGVLHHTGDMDRAIAMAAERVAPGGQFAIAIYNDQGGGSRRWLAIKRGYHRLPVWLRPIYVGLVASVYELKFALARLASGRNPLPFQDWKLKKRDRGMSAWHDWVDWVGGLPFEVAKPESVILPLVQDGFRLENLTTVGSGWGCNEFVFRLR